MDVGAGVVGATPGNAAIPGMGGGGGIPPWETAAPAGAGEGAAGVDHNVLAFRVVMECTMSAVRK
jgi:hypothetical protein